MGLPAFLLGLAIPIIAALGFAFYMDRPIEQQQHQQRGGPRTRRQTPNWDRPESGDNADNCSICLFSMTAENSQPFKCGHKFHSKCIVDLLLNGLSQCPNCRAKIR